MSVTRLSIIGVGLLGGSVGLAARRGINNCRIVGYSNHHDRLGAAVKLGAVDEAAQTLEAAVHQAQLVLLGVPIGQFAQVFQALAPLLPPQTIVTDVGSTKAGIVRLARQWLGSSSRFVGGHPMAGGANSGIDHARADLFDDAACILTREPDTDHDAFATVAEFWKSLGARTYTMTSEEHDRLAARMSHLPHVLASSLVRMQTDASIAVSGRGLSDMTRISAGDPQLWRDILIENRQELKATLLELRRDLDQLESALDRSDHVEVERLLRLSSDRRRAMG